MTVVSVELEEEKGGIDEGDVGTGYVLLAL